MKQATFKALQSLENAYTDGSMTAVEVGYARKAEKALEAKEYEKALLLGAYAIGDVREI